MNEKYIQFIRDAIKQKHGCLARYVETKHVKEEFQGKVWEGDVELFDLAGHATARKCFAWRFLNPDGHWEYVTILNPPVMTPGEAVRGHMAGSTQEKPSA